jgi:pyrimidine-specific ribonucleoside hydrolase
MKYLKVFVFTVAILFQGQTLLAHSGKPAHHVIIDTDGALDDMRAISMLLSGNEIRVLAITCSQGTLAPERVYARVRSLLTAYHHEGIPVAMGEAIDRDLPYWSDFAGSLSWVSEKQMPGNRGPRTGGQEETVAGPVGYDRIVKSGSPSVNAREGTNPTLLLQRTLENYPDSITLVALGSLKTYADWLRAYPGMKNKIKKMIWYNSHNIQEGFNYGLSPGSYDFMIDAGVPIEIVSNSRKDLVCDNLYIDHIGRSVSVYARQIVRVFSDAEVLERVQLNPLWDDLAALYLAVPVLFSAEKTGSLKKVSINPGIPAGLVYETITTLLSSSLATNNRVFNAFPTDKHLLKKAYAEILDTTMLLYGPEEWKAICLTNEIHGHTGIYSIIGAKMGIRAMEYFHVGINNLEATSFAGNTPPLSCLTDGVQISTGATPGQGLLTIASTVEEVPTVEFTFNNRTIRMVLDESVAAQMKREIGYGVKNFGLESDTYWLYIEQLALEYWRSFSRYEIFTITEL